MWRNGNPSALLEGMQTGVATGESSIEIPQNVEYGGSDQDGDIGRYGSPLHTTTSKLKLKYRTTITQNRQKLSRMKVLTTTELKKPHPYRWVGGAQT